MNGGRGEIELTAGKGTTGPRSVVKKQTWTPETFVNREEGADGK